MQNFEDKYKRLDFLQNYLINFYYRKQISTLEVQKALFLDTMVFDFPHYTFHKFYYGPYSNQLRSDLNSLREMGFLKVKDDYFDSFSKFEINRMGFKSSHSISSTPYAVQKHSFFLEQFLRYFYNSIKLSSIEMGSEIKPNDNLKSDCRYFTQKLKEQNPSMTFWQKILFKWEKLCLFGS